MIFLLLKVVIIMPSFVLVEKMFLLLYLSLGLTRFHIFLPSCFSCFVQVYVAMVFSCSCVTSDELMKHAPFEINKCFSKLILYKLTVYVRRPRHLSIVTTLLVLRSKFGGLEIGSKFVLSLI